MNIDIQSTRDKHYVHPWRRYFAKTIDISIFAVALAFIGGIVLAIVNPAWLPTTIISSIIFTAVILFASLILEGVIISIFRTTFGKALFRTGVVNKDGGRLAMGRSVGRSLFCGVAGLGAGIPLVSLMTHILAYTALESDGVTIWDKHMDAYIVHEKMTRLNWVFGMLIFVLAFLGSLALNFAGMAN
ncbi:RDD family protein [Hyphococcus sp.]|jgi:hypothetical protein|uniref:RDD family protein n=1 Tax=Hyphococcus sp. TaxID=2038636 RepID=UPI003D0F5907